MLETVLGHRSGEVDDVLVCAVEFKRENFYMKCDRCIHKFLKSTTATWKDKL